MKYRKFLAMLLSASMIVGSMSITAFAAPSFPDMPNDWSTQALQSAVDNGYISGMDGKLEPKGKLTRAQMASIMNRVFGNTEKGDLSSYTDVPQSAWYYDDMAKAVAAGIFVGSDGKLNPQANITRQEAFSVLARAYKLADGNASSLSKFSDASEVSSWAKGSVAALVEAGIVNGSDGKISPSAEITRAEFAVILYNANGEKTPDTQTSAENLFDKAGTYTQVAEGNVTVSAPGVELKDVKITGNLILAEGIGKGEVKLTNVTVEGDTLVQGGGENSVIFESCTLNVVKVENKISPVRILSRGNTKIKSISTFTNAIFEGNFNCSIDIMSEKIEVRGNITTLVVSITSKITITSGSVNKIEVEKDAPNTSIIVRANGKVETIDIRGTKTEISGSGKITLVQVGANNVTVSVPGTKVTVEKEIIGTKVGKIEIEGGKTVTVAGNGGGGGGGGGGSSSDNDTIYSVEIVTMLDGVESTSSTTRVAKNSTLSRWVAPEIEGYIFEGLYTTSNLTTQYQLNTPVTSNMKLYAKYIAKEEGSYIVTAKNYFFEVTSSGAYTYVGTENKVYQIKENEALALTTPLAYSNISYDLDGIYDAITITNGVPTFGTKYADNTLVTKDMTVSAKYIVDADNPTPASYTVNVENYYITVDENGVETYVASEAKIYTVEGGQTLVVDDPLTYDSNSYDLAGLYESATMVNGKPSFTTPVSDVVVNGKMDLAAKYTRTVSSEPVPEPKTYTVTVDTHYITVDENGVETYVANEAKTYTVEGGQTLSVDDPLTYGGNSYNLAGLYESATMVNGKPNFTNPVSNVVVDGDMSLAAKYTRTVSSEPDPDPEPKTYTVTVDTHYITVDGDGVETYVANEAKTYTVKGGQTLSVDDPLTYGGNSYDLAGLYENVEMVNGKPNFTNPVSSVTVDGDMSLAAKYTRTESVNPPEPEVKWTVNIYQVIGNNPDKLIGDVQVKDGAAYTRDIAMLPEIVVSDTDGKQYKFKEIHVGSAAGAVYNNEPITANTSLYAIYEENATPVKEWPVALYVVLDDQEPIFADPLEMILEGNAYVRDTTKFPELVLAGDGKIYDFVEIRVGSKTGSVYNNDPIIDDHPLYIIYESVPAVDTKIEFTLSLVNNSYITQEENTLYVVRNDAGNYVVGKDTSLFTLKLNGDRTDDLADSDITVTGMPNVTVVAGSGTDELLLQLIQDWTITPEANGEKTTNITIVVNPAAMKEDLPKKYLQSDPTTITLKLKPYK